MTNSHRSKINATPIFNVNPANNTPPATTDAYSTEVPMIATRQITTAYFQLHALSNLQTQYSLLFSRLIMRAYFFQAFIFLS